MTKCEVIQEWRIGKYRFVKSDCLGYAGPRFYIISVYIGEKEQLANAYQVDSCVFTWQAENESYLTFNVCDNTIQERRPHKILLERKSVDSITMYSNELKQTRLLTYKQIDNFVKDWNNSETRGYYPDEPYDSAFSFFPAYQYRLTVFSNGTKRSFYGYNYVIIDSSNWKFEMSKTSNLKYFHNYWKK